MLLLTDRPNDVQELKRLLWAVEPCIIVSLEGLADMKGHSMILSDLSLDTGPAVALAKEMLARCLADTVVPVLHLSRQDDDGALARARAINATAFLPKTASRAQIISTAKSLIQAAQVDRHKLDILRKQLLRATVQQAGLALHSLFSASRRGDAVSTEDVDRGTSAIIATVVGHETKAWLNVVRDHDDTIYQHCLLVTGLVAAFASGLGMTLNGQRQIVTAALLHDIGKARIPLDILNKKGRLSYGEMAVMKTHPGAGYDMLVRQGGFDLQVLDIVRHHHEYVDGSGYPDALQGDAVSPSVRIVTICDIYAALIERRPYKEPYSSYEALAIMSDMAPRLDSGLLATFHSAIAGA